MSARLRVMLADDHAVVREGLAALIGREADMEVVAQAGNGREAVRLAAEARPDVTVMDISMPELDGPTATEQIRASCPGARVVAITRHADPSYVRRMLQAGAAGYVLKRSASSELIGAIRRVAGGGTYVEPTLVDALIDRGFGKGSTVPGTGPLSAREEQVLRAVAWGRSNKEVAHELGLSVKTVESYKAAATEKLQLRSRADIVRYAVGRGWLDADVAPE